MLKREKLPTTFYEQKDFFSISIYVLVKDLKVCDVTLFSYVKYCYK